MTSRTLASLFSVATLFAAGPAGRLNSAAIQGVWKTVEVRVGGQAPQTFTNIQPNLTILTGNHYARVEVHADNPRPLIADVAKATADELRATWGTFAAEAGSSQLLRRQRNDDAPDRREEPGVNGRGRVHRLLLQTGRRHDPGHDGARSEGPDPEPRHDQGRPH